VLLLMLLQLLMLLLMWLQLLMLLLMTYDSVRGSSCLSKHGEGWLLAAHRCYVNGPTQRPCAYAQHASILQCPLRSHPLLLPLLLVLVLVLLLPCSCIRHGQWWADSAGCALLCRRA
jgi:hypothetical protein